MDTTRAKDLVTALSAGANAVGAGRAGGVIQDAYEQLKAHLIERFAGLRITIAALEQNPASSQRAHVLQEALEDELVVSDAELVDLVQRLVALLRQEAIAAPTSIGVSIEALDHVKTRFEGVRAATNSIGVKIHQVTGGELHVESVVTGDEKKCLEPIPSLNVSAGIYIQTASHSTFSQHEHIHYHAPGSRGSLPDDFCTRDIHETRNFTGRADAFEQLTTLLETDNFAAICGLPGNGKSTLAREYGWRYRDVYTVIWLPAESEASIISTFLRLDRELHLLPSGYGHTDARDTALYIRRIIFEEAKKPLLFIFDNLVQRSVFDEWSEHEQVTSLITSRKAIWKEQTIYLDSFRPEEAMEYLKAESYRKDISDGDTRELCELLGYHPLALSHAAAYLCTMEAVPLRKYLQHINRHLDMCPDDVDDAQAVFATFREAITQVEKKAPGAASVLFLSASFMPENIPQEFYEQSSDVYSEAQIQIGALHTCSLKAMLLAGGVEEALSVLHQFSLIRYRLEDKVFSVHRLVQRSVEVILGENEISWNCHAIRILESVFPSGHFITCPRCEIVIQNTRYVLDKIPNGQYETSVTSLG